MWNLVIGWIATAVIVYALTPKPRMPKDAAPATIDDFDFPTAEDGREIPVLFGTRETSGPNVVWYGDLVTENITEKVDRGPFRSSKRVTVGYKYFLGAHKGLVHGPVDSLNRIRVADKVVWVGQVTGSGSIEIDQPEIFGGTDTGGEGGIQGTFTFHNGDPLQLPSTYLQEQLGEPIPAFRGVSCGILEQMYVSAFNPYLKPWAFLMTRTNTTTRGETHWYPEKAAILSGCVLSELDPPKSDQAIYIAMDFSLSMNQIMPNGKSHFNNMRDAVNLLLDRIAVLTEAGASYDIKIVGFGGVSLRTATFTNDCGGGPVGKACEIGVSPLPIVIGQSAISGSTERNVLIEEARSIAFSVMEGNAIGKPFEDGDFTYFISSVGWNTLSSNIRFNYTCNEVSILSGDVLVSVEFPTSANALETVSAEYRNAGLLEIQYLKDWLLGQSPMFWSQYTAGVHDAASFFSGSAPEKRRVSVFLSEDRPSRTGVDNSDGDTFSGDDAFSAGATLLSITGINAYGFNVTSALGNTQFVKYLDNKQEEIPKLDGSNSSLIFGVLQEEDEELGIFPNYDMNPAHIIRECLVDKEWGMGYTDGDIDDVAFTTAADTLYAEQMGISILWQRENTIEAFVQDIVRHIDAALYVDRRTGKFVLKLIRSEATPTLTLGPNNIERVENYKRPAFGDLVNSVTVIYDDCDDGKLEGPAA
jgi:hypothetical protein